MGRGATANAETNTGIGRQTNQNLMNQASGISTALTPALAGEVVNPQGIAPQDMNAINKTINTGAGNQNTLANTNYGNLNNVVNSGANALNTIAGSGQAAENADINAGANAENTASQQSLGGANASAAGQGALSEARTRNAGAANPAIAESARNAMRQGSQNALGVEAARQQGLLGTETAKQNALLGIGEGQQGALLGNAQGLANTELNTGATQNQNLLNAQNLNALTRQGNQQAGIGGLQNLYGTNLNAANQALGLSNQAIGDWNQASNNTTNAALGWTNAALNALGGGAKAGNIGGFCWVAAELYGGWHKPQAIAIRQWFMEHPILRFAYQRLGGWWSDVIKKHKFMRRITQRVFDWILNQAIYGR